LPNDWWAMFSGDINKDGVIDGTDLAAIDNDAFAFVTGYAVTDLNCDVIVDGSEYVLADNNAADGVTEIKPPGAGPIDATLSLKPQSKFKSDAGRIKYEQTIEMMKAINKDNSNANSEK